MDTVNSSVKVKVREKSGGLSSRRRIWNAAAKFGLYFFAALTVLILAFIIGYIFYRGVPNITWELLSTQTSYLNDTIGILPNIVNTIYIVFISIVIAVPLSVGAALYLTEYAKNQKIVGLMEMASETLSGIPSIIFGLVGMLVFINLCGLKQGVLAGSLTLVIMIMPTIIRTTQESLRSVPQSYREGSLALGSGKWHMIRTVVLPNAIDGIITGVILAIGRVVGESAALLFTAGFGLVLNSFVDSLQSSSATLTVALYVYASERGETGVAFAIAVILMIITFVLNWLAKVIGKKLSKT
ncbi:MAG: phosphate ABC transporter permease PstA [Oscillospiraceae bacterium]|jgi:phosphate transport system permease protein